MKRKCLEVISVVLVLVCLLALAGCSDQAEPVDKTESVSSSSSEVSLVSSIASESEAVSEPEAVSSETEPISEEIVTPSEPESTVQEMSSEAEADENGVPINLNPGKDYGLKIFTPEELPYDSYEKKLKGGQFAAYFINNFDELINAGHSVEALSSDSGQAIDVETTLDEYFKKYSIVEVVIFHGGVNRYTGDEFHYLTREGNQLIVNWSKMPEDCLLYNEGFWVFADKAEYNAYLIEVEKEYIQGAEEIVGKRIKTNKEPKERDY